MWASDRVVQFNGLVSNSNGYLCKQVKFVS